MMTVARRIGQPLRSTMPSTSPPDAADDPDPPLPPWGAHRPGLLFRIVLRLSRAIPQIPVIKQLAFLLRRVGRSRHRQVDVRHWGLRLRLLTAGNISESTFLFMPRRWDRREREFLARHLEPGAVFVDVGANAGGYLWWLQWVLGSEWRGLAVEPDPELRGRLRLNLEENAMRHVRVVGAAVGVRGGRSRIRIDPANRGRNVLLPPEAGAAGTGEPARTVEVRVVPLLDLLEEAGLERVDALKVDVEGLEAEILDDFLDRAPDRLFPQLVLTELRDSPEHRALLERLDTRGYRVELRTRLNAGLRRG